MYALDLAFELIGFLLDHWLLQILGSGGYMTS